MQPEHRDRIAPDADHAGERHRAADDGAGAELDAKLAAVALAAARTTVEELDRAPPDEETGEPFGGLTPLGRRLVGLDEWPSST